MADTDDRREGIERPRPAATVVLVRAGERGAECYMLRRSSKSPFMPEALVFPGGRVDAADAPAGGHVGDDAAFEAAARRECREEANVDLEAPLVWFDTWCTPSAEPRRYLARFFLAELPAGFGEAARADEYETHAGRWATASEHLAAWRAGQVDLPPPTACILLRLAERGSAGLLAQATGELAAPVLPKAAIDDGEIRVVMPHAPEYAALVGESAPAPARVHGWPERFIRRGTTWTPA